MDTGLLTWYQALQLAALGPCLFILFFLCVTAHTISKIVVPLLYFISLFCCFLLPLGELLGFDRAVQGALLAGKGTNAALSFLLIIEFMTGRIPPPAYWAILALPLLGGSSIDYVVLVHKGEEICIYEHLCALPVIFKQLYEIFASSLIFLLTIALCHRLGTMLEKDTHQTKNKYAIIIALIFLNLGILAIKLAYASGHADMEHAEMAVTIVRIGFIYLVLTSVFRIFDRTFDIGYERMPTMHPSKESIVKDSALAENIKKLLREERIYRTTELTREALAKKLAVTENYLSRVINQHFSQNFNMLINQCRIDEARERLANETTPVTTIAFEVGFNSIPSFNRVFKQATGVSPSEYRNGKKSG